MRYALLVEYDGTEFHGSQLQPEVRTVQGELERALAALYGAATRVHLASRTDSGVHAKGQVAVYDQDERHDRRTLFKALNYHLPDDVVVRAIDMVDEGFDPRRQAIEREYVYRLNDGYAPSALNRHREARIKPIRQFENMRRAAQIVVGSHDFASFAGPATPGEASTVRNIYRVEVNRVEAHRITVRIVGNAFVHQQVRRLTGAMVRVGTGEMGTEQLQNLLEEPVRGAANWALAPKGLCLTRIEYGNGGPFRSETEYN